MQKRPNHKIIFIALLGALLFILVACGEKGNTEDDMQRAQAYLQDYFTVKMEEGAVAARRFMYFEDDSEEERRTQQKPIEFCPPRKLVPRFTRSTLSLTQLISLVRTK